MRKFLILLALPLIVAAGGRSTHDLASRAKANLAALISDGDYPPSAIRAEQQGIVGFILDVGKDGRVTGCTVESSSGAEVLDLTTCRIMTARAQFVPAHDHKGRPTTDRIHARIRWILPQGGEEEEDGNAATPSVPQPS